MKRVKLATLLLATSALAGFTYFASCTHKDTLEVAPPKKEIVRGNDVVKLSDGWSWDKSHSNVMWETPYDGVGALLTGRFNQFGITTMEFDEANPEKIKFEGWVRLNTVNTGEMGRDTGCLLKTFKTAKGKVDEPENLATIKSKTVKFNPEDTSYIVTADLTFMGITKEVEGILTYSGTTRFDIGQLGSNTKVTNICGLNFKFNFLAKSVFGIVSTSIADNVDIIVNTQYKMTE